MGGNSWNEKIESFECPCELCFIIRGAHAGKSYEQIESERLEMQRELEFKEKFRKGNNKIVLNADEKLNGLERVMKIIRAHKKEFIDALNYFCGCSSESGWENFKEASHMTNGEAALFDVMIKEGIEHEEWMDGKEQEKLGKERKEMSEKECQCTLCFCYNTKKHIDLSDMEIIIQDVKMSNPVSECLERLYREDAKLKQKENLLAEEESYKERYEKVPPSFKQWSALNEGGYFMHKSKAVKETTTLHPGVMAREIIVTRILKIRFDQLDLKSLSMDLNIDCEFLGRFFEGKESVDHILAFILADFIKGTDVRFWMDLQERYDSFKG